MCDYNILIGDDINAAIGYAAKTLKKYIQKICGLDIKISNNLEGNVFSLGKTKINEGEIRNKRLEPVLEDGFIILRVGNSVIIDAKKDRGVIYGVYEYIEKYLGARFLTATCEYIPENGKLILPKQDIVSNPDFKMRTYLVGDTFQKTSNYEHMLRTRVFDLFTPIPSTYGGESLVYGRNFNHNFHYYVPFEKYGNEHPEFYRCIYMNEEIIPTIDLTNGITDDGKLDISKDISVAKIVIEELKKDVISHPEAVVFNFTQEDGPLYFDDEHNRELEKKYKRSGILIRFCNVLVREINKWANEKLHRTIKIMTFAYEYTKNAPVKYEEGRVVPLDKSVIADENLIIQMAFFGNGQGYFSPYQDENVSRNFKEWKVIGKDFWFWGYDANFYRYLTFIDSFKNIEDNVRGFYDLKISYLCIQGVHESVSNWQALMRGYVYRKLMWDRSLSQAVLLEEFAKLYFGIAYKEVFEFIALYENNAKEQFSLLKDKSISIHTLDFKAEFYPEPMLYKAIDIIEKGEERIKKSALEDTEKIKYLKRLAAVKATPLLCLYDNFYDYHEDGKKEDYDLLEKRFFDTAELGGVDFIGERWSIKQYKEEGSASKIRRERQMSQK